MSHLYKLQIGLETIIKTNYFVVFIIATEVFRDWYLKITNCSIAGDSDLSETLIREKLFVIPKLHKL